MNETTLRELAREIRLLRQTIERQNKGKVTYVCGESVEKHGLENLIRKHFPAAGKLTNKTH
jgi:stalled ribosome alternative rescue factor ArfA